jgi:hypothetical protein
VLCVGHYCRQSDVGAPSSFRLAQVWSNISFQIRQNDAEALFLHILT